MVINSQEIFIRIQFKAREFIKLKKDKLSEEFGPKINF